MDPYLISALLDVPLLIVLFRLSQVHITVLLRSQVIAMHDRFDAPLSNGI